MRNARLLDHLMRHALFWCLCLCLCLCLCPCLSVCSQRMDRRLRSHLFWVRFFGKTNTHFWDFVLWLSCLKLFTDCVVGRMKKKAHTHTHTHTHVSIAFAAPNVEEYVPASYSNIDAWKMIYTCAYMYVQVKCTQLNVHSCIHTFEYAHIRKIVLILSAVPLPKKGAQHRGVRAGSTLVHRCARFYRRRGARSVFALPALQWNRAPGKFFCFYHSFLWKCIAFNALEWKRSPGEFMFIFISSFICVDCVCCICTPMRPLARRFCSFAVFDLRWLYLPYLHQSAAKLVPSFVQKTKN